MIGDPSLLGGIRRRLVRKPQVDGRLVAALSELVQLLAQEGYEARISSAYRSRRDQQELIRRWEEGDPDIIAQPAPPGRSAHNFGFAVDIVLDPPDYDFLGAAAAEVGLVQPDPDGDPVHVELPNWRRLTRGWNERRLVAV